jgi:hypothetical protein
MLATMIAQLLEKAPQGITSDAVQDDPTVAAVVGGMDVQHAIVAGAGARAVDSNGNPWQGTYVTTSGNLLADFTANASPDAGPATGGAAVPPGYERVPPRGMVHEQDTRTEFEQAGSPATSAPPTDDPDSGETRGVQQRTTAYRFTRRSMGSPHR